MAVGDPLLLGSPNEVVYPYHFNLAGCVVRVGAKHLAPIALHRTDEFFMFVELLSHLLDLKLFLLDLLRVLVPDLDLDAPALLLQLNFEFVFVFFQIVYLLLEDLYVQLQLLLNLDVVAHVILIHLQLRFVLFRRQIQRLERGREVRRIPAVQVAVPPVVESERTPAISGVFFVLSFQIHEDFNTGPDVVNHCQTVKLNEAVTLLREHVLLKSIDLRW